MTEIIDLQTAGLKKTYAGSLMVLDGITLSVRRGEAVAVIGPNGTGKSTLLRCCLRLLEPSAGQIRVLGQPVTELRPRALRRLRARVGFIFQRHNLVGRVSALSNVVHGYQAHSNSPRLWLQSLAPAAVRRQALDCLDRVGLADLALRRADRLSGGQSQRTAIARALMQGAEMVIADEPVASLDPSAGEDVMRLFGALMRADGRTFIFTTHNLRHALVYADRIIGLGGGRILLDEPAAALTPARLQSLFDGPNSHAASSPPVAGSNRVHT